MTSTRDDGVITLERIAQILDNIAERRHRILKGDRVTVTEFINGEAHYLDGWLIRQTGPNVVISGSPDDDGRDDYDTDMHMRAYFRLGKNVRIRHYGGNK